MRILVTNDDGIDAPGLVAMAAAAEAFGEVYVAAPDEHHSSCSHAFSREETLHAVIVVDTDGRWHRVEGTPVDCVRLACSGALGWKPDVVLSGINEGANVGIDVFPSGTLAAAREGAVFGLPGIAVSQYTMRDVPTDWSWSRDRAAEAIRAVLDRRFGDYTPGEVGLHWNINLPRCADAAHRPEMVVVPHDILPMNIGFEAAPAEAAAEGRLQCRRVGRYSERPRTADGDVSTVFGGRISVTPLTLSMNAK